MGMLNDNGFIACDVNHILNVYYTQLSSEPYYQGLGLDPHLCFILTLSKYDLKMSFA